MSRCRLGGGGGGGGVELEYGDVGISMAPLP